MVLERSPHISEVKSHLTVELRPAGTFPYHFLKSQCSQKGNRQVCNGSLYQESNLPSWALGPVQPAGPLSSAEALVPHRPAVPAKLTEAHKAHTLELEVK